MTIGLYNEPRGGYLPSILFERGFCAWPFVAGVDTLFLREGRMWRERALKVVLVLVGLLFCAGIYPLIVFARPEPALAMMMSIYVTLGIFLLLAARNPSANRSLIAFTAWSSFAHAAVMGAQALTNLIARGELVGVAALVIIGAALIGLAPAKRPVEKAVAVPV